MDNSLDEHAWLYSPSVPVHLRWLTPLVDELCNEDNYLTGLSPDNRKLFEERFDRAMRIDLEDWLDCSEGPARDKYFMAMIALDAHGLLAATEREIGYEFWKSNLSARSPIKRSSAAQMLGIQPASDLDPNERVKLIELAQTAADTEESAIASIWLNWLRCRLGDVAEESLNEWRILATTHTWLEDTDEIFDHSMSALASIPQITRNDIDLLQRVIFNPTFDEYSAAALLEALVFNESVPATEQQRLLGLASTSDSEVVRSVADEPPTYEPA